MINQFHFGDINTRKVTRVEEYIEYLKSIEEYYKRIYKKPEYPPTGIMKPLDIVRTPAGSIGVVTETNRKGTKASIDFINGCNKALNHNAWWEEGDGLEIIDNLPRLLSSAMAHPFGTGKEDVEHFFNK